MALVLPVFFFRVRVKLAQKLAEGISCLQNYLQNQLPYYIKFYATRYVINLAILKYPYLVAR